MAEPLISHRRISLRHLSPASDSVKRLIVDIHNHFRSKVRPEAANMLRMVSEALSGGFI